MQRNSICKRLHHCTQTLFQGKERRSRNEHMFPTRNGRRVFPSQALFLPPFLPFSHPLPRFSCWTFPNVSAPISSEANYSLKIAQPPFPRKESPQGDKKEEGTKGHLIGTHLLGSQDPSRSGRSVDPVFASQRTTKHVTTHRTYRCPQTLSQTVRTSHKTRSIEFRPCQSGPGGCYTIHISQVKCGKSKGESFEGTDALQVILVAMHQVGIPLSFSPFLLFPPFFASQHPIKNAPFDISS
mmetsp:Transcript_26517/g.67880  ORF Transcript_26517/g.67880 Transcript_26517/m.67880 type:complete len:240 (-) Transcript_26517:3011-3730(-)